MLKWTPSWKIAWKNAIWVDFYKTDRGPAFWLRIPLGFWKGKQVRLEWLARTSGWHLWTLIMCLDKVEGGWRFQRQMQGLTLPNTQWEEY